MIDFKKDIAILLDELGLGLFSEEDVNANITFADKESPDTLIIIKNTTAPTSSVKLIYDNVGAQILIKASKSDSSVETLANEIYDNLQGLAASYINGNYYSLIICVNNPYYFRSNINNDDYYTINILGIGVRNETPHRRA